MKKWHYPFLLFLIVATVYITTKKGAAREIPYQATQGTIFGTVFHTKYQHDSALETEIMNALKDVDNSLSMFNSNSCISKINRGEIDIPDSLFTEIFNLSKSISKITNGCFDPTVAPLVNAWGFGIKENQQTDSAAIDSIMEFIGCDKIDIIDNRIVKKDNRVTLDFSAIAKGYGADCVAKVFESKGIENYMVEIGGEIVCKGKNPKGKSWKIGINKPIESETINQDVQNILTLDNAAIATSGNYRNYYLKDGKKIAHTINPKSGYPIQQSIVSSTVMARSCAMADAFATSFMVMGIDSAKMILEQCPQIDAYLIYVTPDGKHEVWCTDKIKQLIEE